MSSFFLTRRAVLHRFAVTGLTSLTASPGLLLARSSGRHATDANRSLSVPSASSTWSTRVRELHEKIDQKDFASAAESAAYLTDEAFTRADRVVQAWLRIRDNYRGLLPRSIADRRGHIWNYKDCAADLYCHFVIEASLINPGHIEALYDVLARESAATDVVPKAIDLKTGEFLNETIEQRIFGAIEYVKDGLLPILERVGPSKWLNRMHELVDAVIRASTVETRYGFLPSDTAEKSGEFLQALARLYHRERRPEHLAAGRAIADAWVEEILPFGQGRPAGVWDFNARSPCVRELRLRDHGNEIVSGLVEWVIAENNAPNSRAAHYRSSVEEMLDVILGQARDAEGFWSDRFLPAGEPPPAPPEQPVNDNWGYLTASYVSYALSLPEDSVRRERYLAESTRALTAAIQYRGALWQRGQMDGYADSIEGAQYLLPFLKVSGAARWIDDEMGILLAYQKPDGFVGKTYLDGNFVRTALLYALFRTQGARIHPWRPGVCLGGVMSSEGLHLAIVSGAPWSGRVIFDKVRHKEHLNMPFEYPRLNGWPEWYTVSPEADYSIMSRIDGQKPESIIVKGNELINGFPVHASERGLRLLLRRL